ncbi:ketosteroid isomerase-related protein [Falsiroseomonas tokyonensis]|uniref:Ketosteroid isomerase-related protein n=1 Tax=Falsiroseomonas tokyonensis TaxID=430521 RepID=A0ABV7BME4_9PROT|nr:ketosteroid isomerase-related protein [Falsiroseomonas tokyonensis]MBU8536229.1 nuclear transport factor 2 family protein [Falsiroseomonas tokyonensis]
MTDAERLIRAYYAAFNAGDRAAMLALLTEDVIHDPNQGTRRTGKPAFAAFMAGMDAAYAEQLADLVVMVDASGSRAAAEFTVLGQYLRTEDGLPEAHGQRYALPAGAFLTIRDGKIARIATHYNLPDWISQVSAPPEGARPGPA